MKYVDVGVRDIAAAFWDNFLSVMTPKNRRAEASFNPNGLLSLNLLIIKSTIATTLCIV